MTKLPRLCLFLLSFQLVACHESCELPAAGREPVVLRRGVNLGDMLEAPSEGAWGLRVEREYFDLIRQAGFDFVRLPVNWTAHARPGQADAAANAYEIDADFFARIDEVVCWSLQRGLPVIINLHHYDELMAEPRVEQFAHLWKQIAEHYRDYSPHLLFELANEPNSELNADVWNGMVPALLAVIRMSNPSRDVIIGPAEWNAFDYLPQLNLPFDPHLIVTFHYYLPREFTHQGATWVEGSEAWMGTDWKGTPEQRRAIEHNFDAVADWAGAHGNPRILLGEFGAYAKAPQDSRVRWTRFVREQAEMHGFAWSYWEFASQFGVYDPKTRTWRMDLVQALLD